MKFQGDIAAIPITDVAQNLSSNRKTGLLTIHRGDELRRLALREGKIVSYSDGLGFSVPDWFTAKGLVDAALLKKLLPKARKTRKRHLGDLLEEAGGIPAAEYLSHLKQLVEEMLYETFTLREGTFEFEEGELNPESLDPEVVGAGLELAVGGIIMESARRLDDWETLRRSIPAENDIYRIAPAEKAGVVREAGEDEVALAAAELLDGTRTIREVIAALPSSRFEALKAIAGLVTRKRARPVEGSEVVKCLGSLETGADKARALALLKTALEREPANRHLLQKIAELTSQMGAKEESAIFHKLLAPQLLEEGDSVGSERVLRQSLELNPRDLGVWEKLFEHLCRKGDAGEIYSFGVEMAKHLRAQGLEEIARDHLARLSERFPGRLNLRYEHADTRYRLGDRAGAVEELLALARDLLKRNDLDEGERALAKVLEYDREHKRAREIYEKVKSGKLARARARRKLYFRAFLAGAALIAIATFVIYDYRARHELTIATRTVFAEGLLERGEYQEAKRRLEEVGRRHPWSLLRILEVGEYLRALDEAARRPRPSAAIEKTLPLDPKTAKKSGK